MDALEEISGIGKATANRMREAGINTVDDLAKLSVEKFLKLKIKGIGKATAEKYIADAQNLLKQHEIAPKELIQPEVEKTAKKKEKTTVSEPEKPHVSKKIEKGKDNLKEFVKKQAECNIEF